MAYDHLAIQRHFVTGTLRRETPATRMLFLTLLFECNGGIVTADVGYLAAASALSIEEVEEGLAALAKPDPDSTSLDEEGRRIVPVQGRRNTWKIVNWDVHQPHLSPSDATKPPRKLADGSDNPAYWTWIKKRQRDARRRGESPAPQCPQHVDTEPETAPFYDRGERENADFVDNLEPNQTQNVHNVHNVHQKKRKEISITPPKEPPLGDVDTTLTPKRRTKRKAVASRGNPKYDEAFERFDSHFPRREGASRKRAEGRLIFDALIDAGEDPIAIAAGAKRYRENLLARNEKKWIQTMPTFLNNRGWEESWEIHPGTEAAQEIEQRKAADLEKRRRIYEQAKTPIFEAWLKTKIEKWLDPDRVAAWEAETLEKLESRRNTMGMEKAAKHLEDSMKHPGRAKELQLAWAKARLDKEGQLPGFWDWAEKCDPEGMPRG